MRERTPQEIANIEIQCWCADGAHAPWKCPACQGLNWAWRKACRHCGGATPDDGAAARRPDPVNFFYPPNHPGAAAADPDLRFFDGQQVRPLAVELALPNE